MEHKKKHTISPTDVYGVPWALSLIVPCRPSENKNKENMKRKENTKKREKHALEAQTIQTHRLGLMINNKNPPTRVSSEGRAGSGGEWWWNIINKQRIYK
jgi:hypothetical protein